MPLTPHFSGVNFYVFFNKKSHFIYNYTDRLKVKGREGYIGLAKKFIWFFPVR